MAEKFREYGWNDEISNEGSEYVILPEGDYVFKVAKVERARHSGSEKIPACNMAKVTFAISGAEGDIEITENFYLCNKFEWKLSALFLAIGQKKRGEPLRMNWNNVTGATGQCHVYVDNFKKKDGSDGQSNKIKKFYGYDEQVEITTSPAPSAPQVPSYYQPGVSWTQGAF